ncbi:glycosyltransferase family 1 protein [Nocardioides gilvus]|uniref:glycosyltransferase family 1 protein n=1 Tax=Nocardioides gilvus TaxID=1735589 RepID=UPI000D746124|nr:glycosyltransferase family 1 protein [Nocardioides gilvus]
MRTRTPVAVRPAATNVLTVASVPSSHVYVRHLSSDVGPPVVRLRDPHPDHPGRSAEQRWWPPTMLDPHWARTNEFDVFHVQFGFDARTPAELSALVQVLEERGTPLVLTVHDLRNPHHLDRGLHDAQLDVLVRGAAALITLTRGAADEIHRRWGRTAHVVPHPHVLEFDEMRAFQAQHRARPTDEFRVGLHVKSLRASMAPMRILPTLLEAVRGIPGGVLQVDGHTDVLGGSGSRRDDELATWLHERAQDGEIDLRIHDYFTDAELWEYLAGLDVSVLPYRFGTHSGWLEACRDIGTTVVAPTCGYYADQGPVHSYLHEEDLFDPTSLVDALTRAKESAPVPALTLEERRQQRDVVAVRHAEIYRSVQ